MSSRNVPPQECCVTTLKTAKDCEETANKLGITEITAAGLTPKHHTVVNR